MSVDRVGSTTSAADVAARVVGKVAERFGERLLGTAVALDEATLVVSREDLRAVAGFLRDDPDLRFTRLSDVCGVDYLKLGREPRFAVVYHFHSLHLNAWVRLRVPVDEDDAVVPSLVGDWPAANWFERETFDLFGIRFEGHPNLTRILLPDDWQGHPLHKDYPFEPEEIEFSFNVDKVNAGRVVRRPG